MYRNCEKFNCETFQMKVTKIQLENENFNGKEDSHARELFQTDHSFIHSFML
jgi:hypothetical protein